MMKRIACILLALPLLFAGCAWFQSKEERSANELISIGMESFEDGKYGKAIEAFEKLKDWYPFSKYAILAELKLADSYFHQKQYAEAIVAYEEFEALHPRNEAIPYVIYQIGQCYFEQVDSIDRDQSTTRKALDTFNRLIKSYPDNEFSKKALAHRTACQKNMAGHDMYVGRFYYKSRHYKAALHRFQSVLTNYPDVGLHHQVLHYITVCRNTIEERAAQGKLDGDPDKKWLLQRLKFW